MSKYFFISDEHYGHDNIIKYCNRPFKDSEEMDNEIIRRHNEVVDNKDIIIHAGDFSMRSSHETVKRNYIDRLKGQHIFLKGSHDYWNKNLPFIWEKKIDNIYVVVCHYQMASWPRSFHGSIQLFGHSHGKSKPHKNQWDIGVDNNNFYPITLKQIMLNIL